MCGRLDEGKGVKRGAGQSSVYTDRRLPHIRLRASFSHRSPVSASPERKDSRASQCVSDVDRYSVVVPEVPTRLPAFSAHGAAPGRASRMKGAPLFTYRRSAKSGRTCFFVRIRPFRTCFFVHFQRLSACFFAIGKARRTFCAEKGGACGPPLRGAAGAAGSYKPRHTAILP